MGRLSDYQYQEPSSTAIDPNKCAHHFCQHNTAGQRCCCRCGTPEQTEDSYWLPHIIGTKEAE